MKWIKYTWNRPVNNGTDALPAWEDRLFPKTLPYSEEAMVIAEEEAYGGKYEIEDDGTAEADTASADEVMNALLGVTE